MELQPHQQRVVDEKTDLDDKITKLDAFITTPTCLALLFGERSRLKHQLDVMREYSGILGDRIKHFGE